MTTENFGDTPETFDMDAWLEQASRPQRTVRIYRDWSLMKELTDLEERIAVAEQDPDPSAADAGAEELHEQYQQILEKLQESALSITVQALTDMEVADITAGVPEKPVTFTDQKGEEQTRWKPDTDAIGWAMCAEATVSPRLSREQITAMHERLGDGPMNILYEAVGELRQAGKTLPSLPFSAGHSADSQE